MGQPAVIGIDLGTSGVKVLVVAEDSAAEDSAAKDSAAEDSAAGEGGVLGQAAVGYQVRAPAPGHAESDPEDWWEAARVAVHEALAAAGPVTITGLAVAGQMH